MSVFVTNPEQALEAMQEQIDILKGQANAIVAKPKTLLEYTDPRSSKYKWFQYERRSGTFDFNAESYFSRSRGYDNCYNCSTDEKLKTVLDYFDSTTKQWIKDNKETFEANQKIIKFNIEQKEKVKLIMKFIGVAETYSTYAYKTSRSRNKTETKHQAGYVGDLIRAIKTADKYQSILNNIQSKREQIEKYGLARIKEYQQKKTEEDKIAKEKTKLAELALLRAKYTPDNAESSIEDLLGVILDENKYLKLAHYLLQNRNDWGYGYDSARNGYGCFVTETELDRKIDAELQELIYNNNGDIDGRVFRDCTYNYDVLFAMVEDKALMSDYNLLNKYLD